MVISARMILLILAFVFFAIATVGIKHPKLDIIAAGLACLALSMIFV